MDLELVSIGSADENAFLKDRLEKDSWIGAHDRDAEGDWQWVADGSSFWQGDASGAPVDGAYDKWKHDEPNDFFGQDCAEMDASSGAWGDDGCDDDKAYVCESQGDACPADPAKSGPGQCGCGVPDTDSDGDGQADCIDECPNDPARIAPGDCGCADSPQPAGTPCNDGLCDANRSCDGSGTCGEPSECQPDSSCSFAQLGGTPYWYCDKDKAFDEARERCQSVGMDLAVIETAAEDAFLAGIIDEDAFIAASDRGKRGVWVWEPIGEQLWTGDDDGGSIAGWYSNWKLNELDDSGDHCAFKEEHGGEWETDECDDDHAYICEPNHAIDAGNPPLGPYLSPVVEGVVDLPNRSLVAVWGYNNGTQRTTTRAVGSDDNAVTPSPADRGQPATFEPGRHKGVVAVQFDGELSWALDGRAAVASSDSKPVPVETRGPEGERKIVATLGDGTEIEVFDEQEQLQQCEQEHADCTAACDAGPSEDSGVCNSNCDARRKACRYWYEPRALSYQRCLTHCERQEAAACPASLNAHDCVLGCRHGTLHQACEQEWLTLTRCWDHATQPIECDPLSGEATVPGCDPAAVALSTCVGPNPL